MTLKNIKWPKKSGAEDTDGFAGSQRKPGSGKVKWRTIVGLLLIYVAVALNWQWIWGLFSLFWILPDLFTGVTYFMEPISRKDNPILYWIIIITWIALAIAIFFPMAS